MKKAASHRTSTASTATRSGELRALLQPFVANGSVAGAVTLVANRDRILSVETLGFADRAKRKPMRADTVFWIASQTKPITATLLMMLVDEKKLRLQDPVEAYLPIFKNQWLAVKKTDRQITLRKPRHPVTIRELLSNTGGMAFSSAMEQPTLDGLSLKDAAGSYALTPLEFEPGSKYAYANAGFNTVGRIIEVVAGQPYEQFLEQRLLRPLGMKDTSFRPSAAQVARLAKAYKPAQDQKSLEETRIGQLYYPLSDQRRHPFPAGGLFSTAADVARFCQMMLRRGAWGGKRYLSEAAVRTMIRRHTPQTVPENYGLGFSLEPSGFGHGGALSTNMRIDVRRGLVLVFLVQHAGYPPGGEKCRETFFKQAPEIFG
ncbi:MAG: serine hydrolase domain-containing protein [Planctomycetota bacterium]